MINSNNIFQMSEDMEEVPTTVNEEDTNNSYIPVEEPVKVEPTENPWDDSTYYSQIYLNDLSDESISIPVQKISMNVVDVVQPLGKCPVFIHTTADNHLFCTSYVTGVIGDVHEYLDLIDTLNILNEGDKITVFIDSPGGYVATGAHVASCMNMCKGKVITLAKGFCASAGSLMWSGGHINKLTPFSLFMYHMSSHGDQGNSNMVQNRATDMVNYVRTTLLKIPLEKGHITEEELELICNSNEDQFIDAKSMYQRIAKRS